MNIQDRIKNAIRVIPNFPKEGIFFKDITPIFLDQTLCNEITDCFIRQLPEKPDAVLGIESRGFLFGFLMANRMNIPFILARKAGKLPGEKHKEEYDLEYGTSAIEIQKGILQNKSRVIIHDDLLATGGTAAAAASLVEKAGGKVAGFTFLVELADLKGSARLIKFTNNIICLAKY
ncbi:MAG: adenine phosphoribosyltransferase [Bacteroidia bacterium]|nr:adenine phosphoribosyltransferase [Bacteroidia bacterium]